MENKIYDILAELHPEFDYKTSNDFISDGMLDSFDVVNLVTELEDAFSISIDGEDILPENFSSIDAIKILVERSEKI